MSIFLTLIFMIGPRAAYSEEIQFIKSLDTIGRTLAVQPCAKPVNVVTKVVNNKHDQQVNDGLRRTECPGLTVEVYVANSSQPAVVLPELVQLYTRNPKLPKSFSIGSSISKVQKLLGDPLASNKESFTYSLSSERPEEDTVSFFHKNGKVIKIIWSWSVD
jgi:hypothetical protein